MTTNQKRITIATLVISSLAIIIEILPLIVVPSSISKTYPVLYYFGNVVSVQFLNRAFGEVHGNSPIGNTNYFELFFYVLMLLGGILYWVSNQREVRLIRFTFSIIGVTAAIGVLSSIFVVAMYYKEYVARDGSFVWMLYAFPKAILLVYLSMWVLKEIAKTISLDTYVDAAGEETLTSTPKIQRFFHHITDTILSVLICSPLLLPLMKFLSWVEDIMGERTTIFLVVVLCRLVYYVLFESILGASAAKLLTGSRVVTFSGQRPDPYNVLLRSLCRNIPFEPISFFGRSGWHDTLSETDVVKEKHNGVPASRYLWIIPATAVIGLASYFGYDAYKDYQYHKRERAAFDAKVKLWMHKLDHPSSSLFILLEEQSSYPYRGTYLKIDSVIGDQLKVRTLVVGSDNMSRLSIADSFEDPSTAEVATIKLSDLRSAVTTDYDNDRHDRKSFRKILPGDLDFTVENIFTKNEPVFNDGGGSLGQGEISMELENCGWPVEIVEVKIIDGNLQWVDPLPMSLEGATGTGYDPCSGTYLHFKTEGNPYADYVVELVCKNSDGDRLVFVMEGAGLTASIERKIE